MQPWLYFGMANINLITMILFDNETRFYNPSLATSIRAIFIGSPDLSIWLFRAVEWAQWFLKQGDAHPLKAIGIVATIIVFGSAMLVKEAWTIL